MSVKIDETPPSIAKGERVRGEEKLRPYPASSGILRVLSDYIATVDPAVFDSLHVMSVPTNSSETVIFLEGIAQITAYPG